MSRDIRPRLLRFGGAIHVITENEIIIESLKTSKPIILWFVRYTFFLLSLEYNNILVGKKKITSA